MFEQPVIIVMSGDQGPVGAFRRSADPLLWRTQVMVSPILMPQAPSPAYEIAGGSGAAHLAPIIVGNA